QLPLGSRHAGAYVCGRMGVVFAMAGAIADGAAWLRSVCRRGVAAGGVVGARGEDALVPRAARGSGDRSRHRVQAAQRRAWLVAVLADAAAGRRACERPPRTGDADAAAAWCAAAK